MRPFNINLNSSGTGTTTETYIDIPEDGLDGET